ncbi:MAG: DUF4331 domain-containing protein [Acidobacteria bacterium]|nr:DUF4331 domain-containing protein [Acidobacteriota bacterium]
MRKFLTAVALSVTVAALLLGSMTRPSQASSHREAPLITADPLADNTDVYAFRSTESGRTGFVTLIANYIPFEEPSGGPHFYKFDDNVLYEIKVDNTGDGVEDIIYQFRFTGFSGGFRNPDTILGMAAPNQATSNPPTGGIEPLITSLDDPDYNEPQFYSVTRVNRAARTQTVIGSNLPTPPNNIGERTTPNYETLAAMAIKPLSNGGRAFAGQRDEGFYIDVGAVFDTLNFRPKGGVPTDTGGSDTTAGFNVNTIAIEVPVQDLTRTGAVPANSTASDAVVGIWATASRRSTTVLRPNGKNVVTGPFRQVSRLGNPLVNELVIPLKFKDFFNSSSPSGDAIAAPFVLDPQLAQLIKAVYGVNVPPPPRNDLVLIFATGIPVNGVTGPTYTTFLSDGKPHEMMRLNVAIAPSASPSRLGLLGGDFAGFPNGRRVFDDVVDIELRAVVGGTPFTPDFNVAPNNKLGDGVDRNDVPYLTAFPYLGTPHSGNTSTGKPHEHHVIVTGTPIP